MQVRPPSHNKRLGSPSGAWQGAAIALLIATLVVTTVVGFLFRSGFGVLLDTLLGLLLGIVGLALFAALSVVLAKVLERVPRRVLVVAGAALGTVVGLRLLDEVMSGRALWPEEIYFRSLLAVLVLHAVFGAAVWTILKGHWKIHGRRARGGIVATVALVVLVDIVAVVWLAREGRSPVTATAPALAAGGIPQLDAPNPAEQGPYAVQRLTYGSPPNERRPVYGERADLETDPVDASPLLDQWKGFKARMRELYWGFGVDRYPLNGTVWYPDGDGTFPLVLVVHGNHAMEEYSDPGYSYLGELLASRGFITVSIDENLTNATWSGDFRGSEMAVRAWILLKHLRQWHQWNADDASPFYGRVDMERIGLIGHSRGGEAVAMAAVFNRLPFSPDNALVPIDTGFAIKSVVAIAPTDYRYARRMTMENVNYMTLHGAYDTDVSNFYGMRQYDRVNFTSGEYWFKFALYIHQANHGQFNTVWGRHDVSPPRSWLLNTAPLLTGEEQRHIAKTYIAGFLESTLRGQHRYLPMFEDPRTVATWLPETGYLHRFEDSDFRLIANYEEDLDVTTTSFPNGRIETSQLKIWHERPLRFREGDDDQINSGVTVGWSASASTTDSAVYALRLPEDFEILDGNSSLGFSLSTTDETADNAERGPQQGTPGIAVALVDGAETTATISLDRYSSIALPFQTPLLLKTHGLSNDEYGETWHPVLKSYRIPLAAFAEAEPSFQAVNLREIRFLFPRERSGVVVLDDIGIDGTGRREEGVGRRE